MLVVLAARSHRSLSARLAQTHGFGTAFGLLAVALLLGAMTWIWLPETRGGASRDSPVLTDRFSIALGAAHHQVRDLPLRILDELEAIRRRG